jgi:hypothetical protein
MTDTILSESNLGVPNAVSSGTSPSPMEYGVAYTPVRHAMALLRERGITRDRVG